jgi:hypothetical protein
MDDSTVTIKCTYYTSLTAFGDAGALHWEQFQVRFLVFPHWVGIWPVSSSENGLNSPLLIQL